MNERLRAALSRAPLLAGLGALLMALLARSSLLAILPPALLPLLFVGVVVGLLPALLASRSPLPGALVVTVPVLAVAAYDQSRLDWLRLLKDFGVAGAASAPPDWLRVALSGGALLVAWSSHAVDTALRLRWSATERGVVAREANAAMGAVLARCALLALLALVGTALVGTLAVATQRLDLSVVLGGQTSLVVPIVAVGLVALAAALVVGRDAPADER